MQALKCGTFVHFSATRIEKKQNAAKDKIYK